MEAEITISIWLFLILVAIAIFWALERILIPGTRWFLRRKIKRAIEVLEYYANSLEHWGLSHEN